MNNNFGWWIVNSTDFISFATSNPVEERLGWHIVWILCNVLALIWEAGGDLGREKNKRTFWCLARVASRWEDFFRDPIWCLLGFRYLSLTDRSSAICLVLEISSPLRDLGAHPGIGQYPWQRPSLAQGSDHHWTSLEGSCQITYAQLTHSVPFIFQINNLYQYTHTLISSHCLSDIQISLGFLFCLFVL